jgi:hypothetical protein
MAGHTGCPRSGGALRRPGKGPWQDLEAGSRRERPLPAVERDEPVGFENQSGGHVKYVEAPGSCGHGMRGREQLRLDIYGERVAIGGVKETPVDVTLEVLERAAQL